MSNSSLDPIFKSYLDERFCNLEKVINSSILIRDEKLISIKSDVMDIIKILEDHESRLRNINSISINLKSRLDVSQFLQSSLTLLAAAIAAFLGMNK